MPDAVPRPPNDAPTHAPRAAGGAADPQLAAWVRDAQAGDRDAFDRLARAHVGALVGSARRLLHDLGEAEEAAADALVKAHAALPRLTDPAAFGAWLHRVVLRVALDRLRARRLDRARRGLDPESAPGPAVPSPRFDHEETVGRVRAAVDRLPEAQRVAVVLHLWEGLGYQDVAALLGCSYDAVRVAVAHARRALRVRLADLVEDAP